MADFASEIAFGWQVDAEVRAAEEQAIAEHFADAPLALASIVRTRVCPWDVEVVSTPVQFDQTAPDSYRARYSIKVVEYPR